MERNRFFRRPFIWIFLVVGAAILLGLYWGGGPDYTSAKTSDVLAQINTTPGNISKAVIEDKEQTVQLDLKNKIKISGVDTDKIQAQFPALAMDEVFDQLNKAQSSGAMGAGTVDTKVSKDSPLLTLLFNFLPIAAVVILLLFFMSQAQGGGSRVLNFGKSKAKLISKDTPKTTFADVAGADEAVEELHEIKDFLQNPAKYQALGAKIPKGVLLFGPPGTGKTLLARAVAGEAGVPFYTISGSDFVEMFVGVGASRVRDLFTQAKENAPAIVFVDEIDAVGRHRGAGLGGGHDEREQTLNQLLVEMDGFESNEGVILVAATNRPDVLDPALLRPGRFDRRIVVNRPDVKGREGILGVHTRKIPMADDVQVPVLARGTAGFSGADLANLVNEAALNAARYNQKVVRMHDFEFAKDKVLMGSERRSMIISDAEKRVTAIHEAGHALLTVLLPHADPIHKVTIIPRGMALGLTQQLPADEKHNYSRDYLNDQIAILMGGRIAEEITMDSLTTGAGNDLERATELSRKMVCEWGMSDAMGPLTFGKKEEQIFLGREIAQRSDYSEDTALKIDQEVKRFVTDNYHRSHAVLSENKDTLVKIAEALLAREVLDADQVKRLAAGLPLDEPQQVAARAAVADEDEARPRQKERAPLVPAMNKPLPQE
jgi:cell division protease FtsH